MQEWDSTPSLSPLNSDDLALDDEDDSFSSLEYDNDRRPEHPSTNNSSPELPSSSRRAVPSYEHRKQFEELRAKQYWRDDWHTDADVYSRFDIGDPSSLGVFFCLFNVIA